MFFGDAERTTPKVSIRNSKKKVEGDKQKFLEKVQQERELRHFQKLQQDSALKIQAFYRNKRALATIKSEQRQLWDSDLERCRDQTRASVPLLKTQIRRILFFFNPGKDSARLDALCQILLENLDLHGETKGRPPTAFVDFPSIFLHR
jgi:ubiquitin-protein ligase E3 C